MEHEIFDLFAKIYLYISKKPGYQIESSLTNFNFVELEQKYGKIEILELNKNVDEIIAKSVLNTLDEIKILLEILIYIDYITQSKVDKYILLKKDYLNKIYKDEIQLCIKNNTLTDRMSGAYPFLTSYFKSIIPIVKKWNCHMNLKIIILVIGKII
jgi:hypothetical protein